MDAEAKALECKQAGNAALGAKDFDGAITHFTKGLEFAPTNAILYSNRSAAFASKQDWKSALEDADNAIKCKPEWGKAYSRKALPLLQLQRYEEAIETCKAGLQAEPGNQNLQNDLKEAENCLVAAEQNVLAEEMLSKGKHKGALGLLDNVVKLDPKCALYWSNRCQASLGCYNYAQAKEDAQKVIWFKPGWHKGYQRMAEVLHYERNYTDACAWYAKALQIKPGDSALIRAFSQAQQEGVLDKARRDAQPPKEEEKKDEEKKDEEKK